VMLCEALAYPNTAHERQCPNQARYTVAKGALAVCRMHALVAERKGDKPQRLFCPSCGQPAQKEQDGDA
jgi:hypothetical protein